MSQYRIKYEQNRGEYYGWITIVAKDVVCDNLELALITADGVQIQLDEPIVSIINMSQNNAL